MTAKLEFNCLPTAIGSMPHTSAEDACRLVLTRLSSVPVWPQLPNRSFLESMYVQFAEGFPGLVTDTGNERIYVDCSSNQAQALEKLYADYLENRVDDYAMSPKYAAGLDFFLGLHPTAARAVKGQVVGPVSWGLTVTDQERRPVIYDETLADAVAKHLRLKAAWQERALRALSPNTIMFVDEPYLASIGSAFVSVSRETVLKVLNEVLGGIKGMKGVHCCGNTDWALLLETGIDILSFDAYNYASSFALYAEQVNGLLSRGGCVAWGIVPNEEKSLAAESLHSLLDRLEEGMAPFTRKGIRFRQLLEQGLLTPSCGLAGLSIDGATRALELLVGLSERVRARYL